MSYRTLFVGAGLLALLSGTQAQSACGLQGFSSCTDKRSGATTGYGCCPIGFECYATECEYTGTATSTAPPVKTTACPGFPAHHLCPEASGGGCCYNAHACDPDNASQCKLTKTERVFEEVVTITTVIGGNTETTTSTSIFYPWPTVEPRVTPSGGAVKTSSDDDGIATATASDTTDYPVTRTSIITVSNSDAPETTPAPGASKSEEEAKSRASSTSTRSAATAAAGNLQARVGAVMAGLVAGLMVQN